MPAAAVLSPAVSTHMSPPPIEHAKRDYQSFPGAQYVLPTDNTERERLALQHRLLTRAFEDRLIHPPVALPAGSEILDSGTGSGIWLLDAIKRVPATVVLRGLDIEPRLFPRQDESVIQRGNVHFSTGSITKLPEDWSNKFTLIHQRLLIAALRSSEWIEAVREMFRTLQPGGWVQLDEAGSWKAGAMTSKHIALVQALFATKGLLLNCAVHIPMLLSAAGFINVTVEERILPLGRWAGEVGAEARDNFMGVFRGMKTPVLNAGGLGFVHTETEWDALLDALENEWDDMRGAEIKFHVMYAQKPDV